MSTRNRIVFLLVLAMCLGGSTAAVSIRSLLGVSGSLREISEHDMALTRTLSEVAAGQLEQAIQLERALRFGGEAPANPAASANYRASVEAFDLHAGEMWRSLQHGIELGEQAPAGEGAEIVASLTDLNGRHDAYATGVREVFGAFDDGRFADARALEVAVSERQAEFDRALRGVLIALSETADVRTTEIASGQREAIWIVAGMSFGAIGIGLLLMGRVLYLVRQLGTLRGLLPICSSCKKIRDDQGSWNRLEEYVEAHSEAEFTHGLCGGCVEELKEATLRTRSPVHKPA